MADKKRFVFAERSKSLQIAATCGLSVISEQQVLTGYQIYIVEQWYSCTKKRGKKKASQFFLTVGFAIETLVPMWSVYLLVMKTIR